MYTSTFTFAKGAYDHAFHALDATIAQVAQSIPGYLGEGRLGIRWRKWGGNEA